MKANTPSLILYFLASILTIIFTLVGEQSYLPYTKSLVVSSIFIYYLTTNNYKIDVIKAGIFLFSFIGDVFILMNYDNSEIGSVLSFLMVYLLLITHLARHLKKIKLNKIEIMIYPVYLYKNKIKESRNINFVTLFLFKVRNILLT